MTMQTEPTTKAELIQALLDDPDFLAAVRKPDKPLFNEAGQRIGVNPLAVTGRVVVAPGQTISSASWGNPVWDQSINCFASAADRDTQWPSPHDGAVCYQVDTGTLWIRRAGVWAGIPKGTLAYLAPAANSALVSGNGSVVTWYTMPAVSLDGVRRIKITNVGGLQCGGAAGDTAALDVMEGATLIASQNLRFTAVGGSGQSYVTNVAVLVPVSGSHTYSCRVRQVAGSGVLGFTGGPAMMHIEDIGT